MSSRVIPEVPISQDEFEVSANDSFLGWKMGRRLSPEERAVFFDRLWLHNALHSIDSEGDEHRGAPILRSFAEALQHPFEGGSDFGIESILGSEHITFAYSGGYLFIDQDNILQMYLTKNIESKKNPFGDFHDLADWQFYEEFDKPLRTLENAERCLFFHAWNTANSSIEYFVVPVETIYTDHSHMRVGEQYDSQLIDSLTDQQLAEFEKQYGLASYGLTRVLMHDPERRHHISALLAADQIYPRIRERMEIRIDTDMQPDQAMREAMRERLLLRAGVKDAFSRYWDSAMEQQLKDK